MNPILQYTQGIHRSLGYHATWLPDEKLTLGDVGVFERGRFVLRTSLARLNIRLESRRGHGGALVSASAGSQLESSLDGRVADASARIAFGSAGSFVFQAANPRTDAIANMAEVGHEILIALRAGDYRKDWIVIDRVVTAQTTTVLIASSHSAEVVLGAKVPIDTLQALADGAAELQVKRAKGEVIRYLSAAGLTPLFGASRLRSSLWSGPEVTPMRSRGGDAGPAILEEVTDDDRFGAEPQ